MSDCNVSEYLETIEMMSVYDKRLCVRSDKFTADFRSLGNGVLGWHTLMQKSVGLLLRHRQLPCLIGDI